MSLNRIYQGRIARVQKLVGKGRVLAPADDLPLEVLWEHHCLF